MCLEEALSIESLANKQKDFEATDIWFWMRLKGYIRKLLDVEPRKPFPDHYFGQ
jgi:hypothetical protein